MLRLKKKLKDIDVIFLSINEDLSLLVKNDESMKYINYDENYSFAYNIDIFLNCCNIKFDTNNNYSEIYTNFSLYENCTEKSILINIGSGCKGECAFCNISDSQSVFRNIESIIAEIKSLLDIGVKYFHIANHNFSSDHSFIETFCKEIKKIVQEYDFYWSCFIIPGFFRNNIDLFPLMVEANLGKIEIGCESGSENILNDFNLKHSNSDVEKIINEAICAGVPVIGCHFIIGSKNENTTSLNETKEFIMKILDFSSSLCDIYIHSYFPEKDLHDRIYYDVIKKRHGFISNSNDLDILDLNKFRKTIFQSVSSKRKELAGRLPLKILYKHYQLSKYKIKTQVFSYYIIKSLLITFFIRKESTGNGIFFSWEITDSIDNYTPIYYDPTYIQLEELKEDYSNLNRIILYYLKKHLTVGELIGIIQKITGNTIGKSYIIQFLKELESGKKLFYSKYLN